MRVAALYDIHGNLPALEAVVRQLSEAAVDHVVVGGDVFPGPMACECLDHLAALRPSVSWLRGNGERETLAVVDGVELTTVPPVYRPPVEWCARQLRAEQVGQLRGWPAALRLEVPGLGPVLFCHATPRSDTEILTRHTPEASVAAAFEDVGAALVVCGHTHMAFDRHIAGVRVINAGSVGMPFGPAGADWLLLDTGGPSFVHTMYDLEAAAARIRETRYPGGAEFALRHVLEPPTEAAILSAFGGGRD